MTAGTTEYGVAIFDQHAEMLRDSGITPEHARKRGYMSVDTKKRLEGLKITKAGRNIPGLLIPQRRKDQSIWGHQYRPDEPRLNDKTGKPIKYETPYQQRNGIDVPPGVGPNLMTRPSRCGSPRAARRRTRHTRLGSAASPSQVSGTSGAKTSRAGK